MILKGETMNLREDLTQFRVRSAWSGLILALLLSLAGSELYAQGAPAGAQTTIRGQVVSLNGPDLVVASPNGNVKVMIGEKTIIRGEVPMHFSEITSGMYLGTTATKQPDGNFLASEVHVFSEDQRGTGEGHRPLSSAPESGATMTNGNVERVEDMAVKNVKGRLMTLKYKDGEVKVFVPPDIPLVKRVPGDRSLLNPGAELTVQATRGSDGSPTASQVTVRATRK
jgi:hypothetical protein